jgi:Flp pilus assembly protein TadG
MRHADHRRQPERFRRGAIAPMVAVLLPILVLLVGFAVNVAYMELVRTQLRISCDSAAKAGLISIGATQNTTTAQNFARTVSATNLVGGKILQLSNSNIEFGNATKNGGGTYVFSSGGTPINASRVTGTTTVPYLFGAFMPNGNFNVTQVSLTARVAYDIALVLDRSASMAFDLSGNEFVYPSDRALFSPLQAYFTPPSPTGSRWNALTDAVDTFVSVLQSRNIDAHVCLVTFAENYSFGNYSATEASLDVKLTPTYSQIVTGMNAWSQTPLLGDTNMQAGLALSQSELTGPRARATANRLMILLSDGVATTGNTNIASLTQAARQSSSIVTYTIAFGGEAASGTPQAMMAGAAASGHGVFYNAPSAAQLQTAFQQIADSLPAVLID